MGRHARPKDPRGGTARRAVATGSAIGALGTGITVVGAEGATAAPATRTVWDRLAMCESSGNFRNQDTGRNGHFGGFQFSPATWRGVGGSGNPANASIAEQLKRAKILLSRSGPGQWECKVGLTRANGASQGLTVLGGSGSPAQARKAPGTASNAAGERAVAFVRAQLGKPYLFGGTGPNRWDCSGLVQAAWRTAGVSLPRVAVDQWKRTPGVSPALVRPGDLVVYRGGAHIAMYVGNGQIIEAPRPGSVVRTAPFKGGWYTDNFTAVVRPGGTGNPGFPLPARPAVPKPVEPRAQVPVPPTVAKPGGAGTYKIKPGDWLAKIAERHNVRGGWQALYALNKGGIEDPDLVYPGEIIRLS